MKKIKFILVMLLCVLFVTACGGSNESSDSSDSSKTPKSSSSSSSNQLKKSKIDETVILDKKDIKITAKKISVDSSYLNIDLLIENNSDRNITISDEEFSINDIMLDPLFIEEVAAGKKANTSMEVDLDQLEVAKIKGVNEIEFSLRIYDSDSYKDIIPEENIKLSTNLKGYEQKYNTDGEKVVDEKDVVIYVLKLDDKDSFWGADLYVYAENNTDRTIRITAKDVSINGFMVDPAFYLTLSPGKKAYDTIAIFEEDLTKNDIKNIEELELKFNVYDKKSYKDILNTGKIKLTF